MKYNPTTELDAVNIMLQMIGEQPVNTLPVEGFYEASMAQNTLNNVSREIQSSGLHCNQEFGYPLALSDDGSIGVPNNALVVLPNNSNLTQRGEKLYDMARHTYEFPCSEIATVVWFLPFNELPQHVKNYVTIKAARKLLVELVGASELYQQTNAQEFETMINFRRQELRLRRLNMLQDPRVASTAHRGRIKWL